jgi:phenylpyruvate tautomerase PptA (4-oxalocrotonate tautomerase family)
MPYANIRNAGTLTCTQEARITVEITDTPARIAHEPKSYAYIALGELPDENRAIAGERPGRRLISKS